jgi:hypothetical protein
VGCGITRNGDVYFTMNGLILPLINVEMQGRIYPLISLRGKYTSVQVELGPNFLFNHDAMSRIKLNPLKEV